MKIISASILMVAAAILLAAHSIAYEINRASTRIVYTHDVLEVLGYAVGIFGVGMLVSQLMAMRKPEQPRSPNQKTIESLRRLSSSASPASSTSES